MLGTAEETAAAAVGATSYQQAGKERREAGDAEYKVGLPPSLIWPC